MEKAIVNLLANAEFNGIVVRWSTAHALGQILKLKSRHNHGLLPAIENICEREKDNAIRKIYLDAIKKAKIVCIIFHQ